jgi:hypothetical protein
MRSQPGHNSENSRVVVYGKTMEVGPSSSMVQDTCLGRMRSWVQIPAAPPSYVRKSTSVFSFFNFVFLSADALFYFYKYLGSQRRHFMNKRKPKRRRLRLLFLFPFLVPFWLLGWILYYVGEGLKRTRCSKSKEYPQERHDLVKSKGGR